MTPQEMQQQVVPQGTTRHAFSVKLGMRIFYRDDVTPHQEHNGFVWCDIGLNGNCHSYSTPIDEEAYLPVPKYKTINYGKATPLWSKND